MKKTPKKSNSKSIIKHKAIELPSENKEMEAYVLSNRVEINEKIVDAIEYAIRNRMATVEIFCFKGSSFVVVLHRKNFKESLENVYNFSKKNEKFEICVRIKKIIDLLNLYGFIYNCKKKAK